MTRDDGLADFHSVVTVQLVDREGEPTTAARDEILDFLVHRLHGPATSDHATDAPTTDPSPDRNLP